MFVSKRALPFVAIATVIAASACTRAQSPPLETLRPPSVPLVAHDPYFSIWSGDNDLAGSPTRHWTGQPHTLTALVRVDGESFRLMGVLPDGTPALPQTGLQVLPTRTIYQFANGKVGVTLTFTTPALPDDLAVLSRPVTYITFAVRSLDGAAHSVQIYDDAGAELAVNTPNQSVVWNRASGRGLTTLRIGSREQPVLAKRGDDLRIDWGYLYLSAPDSPTTQGVLAPRAATLAEWSKTGRLPAADDANDADPRTPQDGAPVAALAFDLGQVAATPVSRLVMIAYDDEQSVTYMTHPLAPYWRKDGMDMAALLPVARDAYEGLQKRCAAFDTEIMADLRRVGGEKYAQVAALAYRQSFAANKIVADDNGAPLMFSKENNSNGCVATVDILYPAAPQLLLFSPTLAKASLVTVLNYSSSSRWKFPFAPHDLGTYPRADGQVYGGGERTEDDQMPVEETGNMMILLAAVAQIDGNTRFADPFWPQIKAWATYLEAKGFDPERQLSTDDFAGHLAHNVNLSAKAIEALGAYSLLCGLHGDKTEAGRVRGVALEMAKRWEAEGKDGDHFRLAFDQPNTWSQKYNLVWDRILGLNLFSPSVMQTETAFYKKNLNRYGLPLDNRKEYTKLDWTIWSATLSGSRSDFETIASPVFDFLTATGDRNPMSDWYETKRPSQVGFKARAVVGGVFLPLLTDAVIWNKWAGRDPINRAKTPLAWAPLPKPPVITPVVATSENAGIIWRYTFEPPPPGWTKPDFSDAGWKSGPGGFGRAGTSGAVTRTIWDTGDIWIRRKFTVPANLPKSGLMLSIAHDEDSEVYFNGVLASKLTGYNTSYETVSLTPAGRAQLVPGKTVTVAVHCHQTTGGQGIDVGLVTVTPAAKAAAKPAPATPKPAPKVR